MGAVLGLQSTCKEYESCLNTAFMLQESIATAMKDDDQVHLAFFVWIKVFFSAVGDRHKGKDMKVVV